MSVFFFTEGQCGWVWRKAGPLRHLDDVVDSDQKVVKKEFSLWIGMAEQRAPRLLSLLSHGNNFAENTALTGLPPLSPHANEYFGVEVFVKHRQLGRVRATQCFGVWVLVKHGQSWRVNIVSMSVKYTFRSLVTKKNDKVSEVRASSRLPQSSLHGGLMWSEWKHGLSTENFPVSACVGSSKNLKALKDLKIPTWVARLGDGAWDSE